MEFQEFWSIVVILTYVVLGWIFASALLCIVMLAIEEFPQFAQTLGRTVIWLMSKIATRKEC